MALATFKHFPEIKVVKGGLLFVVCNAFIKDTYTIENEATLWQKWLGEYGKMEQAYEVDTWNPRPFGTLPVLTVLYWNVHITGENNDGIHI